MTLEQFEALRTWISERPLYVERVNRAVGRGDIMHMKDALDALDDDARDALVDNTTWKDPHWND